MRAGTSSILHQIAAITFGTALARGPLVIVVNLDRQTTSSNKTMAQQSPITTSQKLLTRVLNSVFLVLLFTVFTSSALAQENNPKYEIGVLFSALNVTEKSDKDSGIGVRFTYNLTDYLGVEAETSSFARSREGGGNNEVQGLFGVRAGIRKERYGVFAKVRSGVTRFYLLGVTPGPNTFGQGHDRVSVDVGGVFEYYPSRHTAFRVDVGDTIVHFKQGDFFYQRLDEPMFVNRRVSHNLQINLGFALRF